MGRFRVLKNSLLGGQISRNAVGRTDLPQYAHACELLQNMIPLLSGGAYRRPGTLFQDFASGDYSHSVSAVVPVTGNESSRSSPPRTIPFIVDQKTSYALVIGTNRRSSTQPGGDGKHGGAYLRYYKATGNRGVKAYVPYDGILPYRCKTVSAAASGTGEAIYARQGGLGAAANGGVSVSGSAIWDVADSLQSLDDDIWDVQFCQANDVMFLTHPDYPPQTVWLNATDDIRAQAFDWQLSGLAMAQSRPYLNMNSTAATMSYSWLTGHSPSAGGTLTSSVPFFDQLHGPRNQCFPEDAATWYGTDGAVIALVVGAGSDMTGNNSDNGILFLQINQVFSSTSCAVTPLNGVPSNYSKGAATASWFESAWSNYRGWPKACAIYQGRLAFASTKHQPSSIWFTSVGAYGAPVSGISAQTSCKFTALGDGPNQGFASGTKGTLANGQTYSTPANWVYYKTDNSQGDGQSTGPLGSQPFRVSLATTSLDNIQYLSPDQQLFIGTATQEWIGAPVNGSFDVANSTFTTQSHYGSDGIQAIRIGYELMFVHQKKDEIRAYQYNFYDQSFFGEPVQLMFDEYPKDEENRDTRVVNQSYAGRKKYRQIEWDSSRSTLWCVDTAGNLFGLTRDRKLAITSWHTHQFGGYNPANGVGLNITDNLSAGNSYTDAANFFCDGSVVSVCSTPSQVSGLRDIWLVIKRTAGGVPIYSIERMTGGNTVRQSAYSAIMPGTAQEPIYTDCSYFLTDHGDPTNLSYTVGAQLSGQQMVGTYFSQDWGLFALTTQSPVDGSGNITLQADLPADYGTADLHQIVVGLGYSSIVQPVRVDPPSPIGTSQGAVKRVSKAYLRLFKTLMLKMGSPTKFETIRFDPSQQLGQSPEIFTGDKQVFLPTTYDRDGYVCILQDQPLPFTLVSISLEGQEYEQ